LRPQLDRPEAELPLTSRKLKKTHNFSIFVWFLHLCVEDNSLR
jgi:hypothetical protein